MPDSNGTSPGMTEGECPGIKEEAGATIAGTNETGGAMTKLRDLKTRFMEDPEFRKEYARTDEEYALVEALVRANRRNRLKRCLTVVE